MRAQEDWLDAETALRELHADGSYLERWRNDEEAFVADMMEFAQAAYAGGYEDAMDDLEEVKRDRLDDLNRSLTRLDDSYKS